MLMLRQCTYLEEQGVVMKDQNPCPQAKYPMNAWVESTHVRNKKLFKLEGKPPNLINLMGTLIII